MVGVQRRVAADRQANAVDGNRKTLSQMAQLRQRAAAIAHVVFGMDFQPVNRGGIGQNIGIMLGFVTDAGAVRQLIDMSICSVQHRVAPS